MGDAAIGLAITLGATLPWLHVHLRDETFSEVVIEFLQTTAAACTRVGWTELQEALLSIVDIVGVTVDPGDWSKSVCKVGGFGIIF